VDERLEREQMTVEVDACVLRRVKTEYISSKVGEKSRTASFKRISICNRCETENSTTQKSYKPVVAIHASGG